MKKILVSTILVGTSLLANIDCPKLDIKNTSSVQIENSKKILDSLEKMPTIKEVYIDVLKAYNKTNDVSVYVNEETLNDLSDTELWVLLNAYKYLGKDDEYIAAIDKIDSNNSDWCKK